MRGLALLLLLSGPIVAGTTISDTINDASGRPVLHGSITFTPTVTFEATSNANWVSRLPVSATINAGVFSVSLEPTPAGACYNVTFSPATISGAQLAAVPASGSPLTLSQIIGATSCSAPSIGGWFIPPPPTTGTYCLEAVNSSVSWGACTGTGSALSWAHLTNSQWTGMTNSQWTGMTN